MRKHAVAMAVAILLFISATPRTAQTHPTPGAQISTIRVAGKGSVQAEPDTATIRIGVTTEDANAQHAVQRNTAATAKVISELQAASIEKKDLKTSNFSVYPQYRTEGENKRQVTSYRVSNTVMVTIRDLQDWGHFDQGRHGRLQPDQRAKLFQSPTRRNTCRGAQRRRWKTPWRRRAPMQRRRG